MNHITARRWRRTAIATACLLGSSAVLAQATGITTKISGFGSLYGTVTNTDDTEYRGSLVSYRGAGESLDIGTDSRLGIQGVASFANDLSVTSQVVARRSATKDFDPRVEWLYAQYAGLPGLELRLGRVALPAFMISESRQVGYATTTLRVAPYVYGLLPIESVDGAQANYRHTLGDAVVSAQLSAGNSRVNLLLPGATTPNEIKADELVSLNGIVEWGNWTARIGRVRSKVDLVLFPKFTDTFDGYGVQYDNGKAIVVAEYVRRKTEPRLLDASAWYLTAGWRFGALTPYAMLSHYASKTALGPPGTPVAPAIDGHSVGLRYDVARNVALKADLSRLDTGHPTIFTTVLPTQRKVTVMSAGLDFIF
jgi:predicted porin